MCRLECGLYYPLAGYSIPPHVLDIEKALSEDGIGVVMYDRSRHHGFDELFDALHGEVWRRTIEDNGRLASPLPVLVAVHDDLIIGFAGPIACEENGRGWFNGVAVHPDWQRRGIARVLFSRLLGVFHAIGAGYSTIFTDEGNPALHLYESIGFRTGGRFAVMERTV